MILNCYFFLSNRIFSSNFSRSMQHYTYYIYTPIYNVYYIRVRRTYIYIQFTHTHSQKYIYIPHVSVNERVLPLFNIYTY